MWFFTYYIFLKIDFKCLLIITIGRNDLKRIMKAKWVSNTISIDFVSLQVVFNQEIKKDIN